MPRAAPKESHTKSFTSSGYTEDDLESHDDLEEGNPAQNGGERTTDDIDLDAIREGGDIEYSFQQVLERSISRFPVVSATEFNDIDFWSIDGLQEERKRFRRCCGIQRHPKLLLLLTAIAVCAVEVEVWLCIDHFVVARSAAKCANNGSPSASDTHAQIFMIHDNVTSTTSPTWLYFSSPPSFAQSRHPSGLPSTIPSVSPSASPTLWPSDLPSHCASASPSLELSSTSPSTSPSFETIPLLIEGPGRNNITFYS